MISSNPMQLKVYIKKMAAEKNLSAQLIGSWPIRKHFSRYPQ